MATGISLIVIKNGNGYDMTSLVESVKWKGRKGSAARSITATLIDDDGYKHARPEIDVEQGHQCIFSYDGKELFRGIIMSQKQSQRKKMTITAYDNGIYLANNKDTFSYENKTATEIFKDCCSRFGIPYSEAAETSYKIPELTKPNTTVFDAICDALSLDFEAVGIRHYVQSDKGKLKLITRRENIMQWVIETGQNLVSYSYTKSIEDTKTRIKLISDEGTVLAEKSNAALEKKIGTFQNINKPDETLSAAQINELAESMLEEQGTPERSLDVEAMGIPEVISGVGVFIIISELGLSKTFYVDEDTHTFTDQHHTMSLKLNHANDLNKQTKKAKASSADYKVGDIVQFAGGSHYVSSNATSPTGGACSAGPAKITLKATGAKHPWHLIHTDGKSRVYGWVDEGTFSKS